MLSTSDFFRKHLKDTTWLRVAFEISALGTCSRRKVGAVFLDSKGRVLSTGYNGTAPGTEHCTDSPCDGAKMPSGEGLKLCEAIHAEQNALVQCKFPDEVHTVYCTDSPCIHCVKMLASTGCKRIVFGRLYPHSTSKDYWESLGRSWFHLPEGVPGKGLTDGLRFRAERVLPGVVLAFLSGAVFALFIASILSYGN